MFNGNYCSGLMVIEELRNYTQTQFEELKGLMSELSERITLTQSDLISVLRDSNSHLYVILDEGHLIGCATLCIYYSPSGTKASIEDVVVSSVHRGQHLGTLLMEYVIEEARKFGPIELHLTSKPSRVEANGLYQKVGFEKRETNVYRLMVKGI